MPSPHPDRRRFLKGSAATASALALGLAPIACDPEQSPTLVPPPPPPPPEELGAEPTGPRPKYTGPNVVVVRFGGGVRRRETIRHDVQSYCPFVLHELAGKQGILFNDVAITSDTGVQTSHGEGTLNIITGTYGTFNREIGHYEKYKDVGNKFLGARFEAQVPTIFEYLRKAYDVPQHQALIVNGEDRIDEEFYSFSNHHQFGVRYRSTVLSLYRFKTYLLRQELADAAMPEKERRQKEAKLHAMENKDYREPDKHVVSPELDRFWADWRRYYGASGFVNPRGDRLLTELSLRALKQLRPKLMMIHYQDPDYVHWGPPDFYSRAISIIDDGVRQLWDAVHADEEYRDNTVFVIVPDCGRDDNRCMAVPFQHHFNSHCAHEVFAIVAGPKALVARANTPVDKRREQVAVTATIGKLMKFETKWAATGPLGEAFA